jgi:uncharacterized protein YlxW (UPF0749 family)
MRLKLFAVLALAAAPVFANTAVFTKYENVRQGLLKQSVKDTQVAAKQLSAAARTAKNANVQKAADAVAASKDLKAAREAFSTLSEEMIKLRNASKSATPAVAYCPMVKKSWLQARSEKIGNPYDSAMQLCGMFKKD